MHDYRVGQPYSPTRRGWPEIAQYNYRQGGHELVLFFRSPTSREIRAVRQGAAEFALYHHEDLVVLLYRFGPPGEGVPWSDAPYTWHLVPPEQRTLPPAGDELGPEARALLSVILVDAGTGIVRALRQVSLSPEFTRALHDAIREQAARTWSEPVYDAQVDMLYGRYPTTEALLAAARARTAGGA